LRWEVFISTEKGWKSEKKIVEAKNEKEAVTKALKGKGDKWGVDYTKRIYKKRR